MNKPQVSCVRQSGGHLSKVGGGEVKTKICISLKCRVIKQSVIWHMLLKLHVLRLYKVELLDVQLVHHVDTEGPHHGHDGPCPWARPGQVVWVSKGHGEELFSIHWDVEDGGGMQIVTWKLYELIFI